MHGHPSLIATDSLQAIPASWYTVGSSAELRPGQIKRFTLADIPLVLYRTSTGLFQVMTDRCPHLGGSFTAGGQVIGETLQCPVHHLRFNTDGSCHSTGYGTTPPTKACAKPWFVAERNGLLLVYYHPQGLAPEWQVPESNGGHWSANKIARYDINSHPQIVMEGIADKGHLQTVHGYEAIQMDSDFVTDGYRLQVDYSFTNLGSVLGTNALARVLDRLMDNRLRVQFSYEGYGMGYSITELYLPKFNLRTRHMVNPTPISYDKTALFVTMSMQTLTEPGRISPVFNYLPEPWVRRLMFAILWHGYQHDIMDDIKVWETMRSVEHPALCLGDGPIHKYRKWTRQFYRGATPT